MHMNVRVLCEFFVLFFYLIILIILGIWGGRLAKIQIMLLLTYFVKFSKYMELHIVYIQCGVTTHYYSA